MRKLLFWLELFVAFLASLLAFFLCGPADAQQVYTYIAPSVTADYQAPPQSITSACASSNPLQCSPGQIAGLQLPGTMLVNITVSGTYSGLLQFEGSADCVTFNPLPLIPAGATSGVSSTSATGTFGGPSLGYQCVQARASAWASGTAKVIIHVSPLSSVASMGSSNSLTAICATCSGPVFNAANFGTLDPVGIVDAQPAIQGAVNACSLVGGGTVWIPPSTGGGKVTYTIGNTSLTHITPLSNCSIMGPGPGIVTLQLQATAAVGGIIYNATNNVHNVRISGLTFDVNGASHQNAINETGLNTSDWTIDHNEFTGGNGEPLVRLGAILDPPGCGAVSPCAPVPGATAVAGGSIAQTPYYYGASYLCSACSSSTFETQISPPGLIVVSVNNLLQVPCPAQTGQRQQYATGCNIYAGVAATGTFTVTSTGNVGDVVYITVGNATMTVGIGGQTAATAALNIASSINGEGQLNASAFAIASGSTVNVYGFGTAALLTSAVNNGATNVTAGQSSLNVTGATAETLQSANQAIGTSWTEPTSGLVAGATFPGYSALGMRLTIADNTFHDTSSVSEEPLEVIATAMFNIQRNRWWNVTASGPLSAMTIYGYNRMGDISDNIFDETTQVGNGLSHDVTIQNGHDIAIHGNMHYGLPGNCNAADKVTNGHDIHIYGETVWNCSSLAATDDWSTIHSLDSIHVNNTLCSYNIDVQSSKLNAGYAMVNLSSHTDSSHNICTNHVSIIGNTVAGATGYGLLEMQNANRSDAAQAHISVLGNRCENPSATNAACIGILGSDPLLAGYTSVYPNDVTISGNDLVKISGGYGIWLDGTHASNHINVFGNNLTTWTVPFRFVNSATANIYGNSTLDASANPGLGLTNFGAGYIVCTDSASVIPGEGTGSTNCGNVIKSNSSIGLSSSIVGTPTTTIAIQPGLSGGPLAISSPTQVTTTVNGTTLGYVAPVLSSAGGVLGSTEHIVYGTTAFSAVDHVAVTLTGGAPFTSASSYVCRVDSGGSTTQTYTFFVGNKTDGAHFTLYTSPSTANSVTVAWDCEGT